MKIELSEKHRSDITDVLNRMAPVIRKAVYAACCNHFLYDSPGYISNGVAMCADVFFHEQLDIGARFSVTGCRMRDDKKKGMLVLNHYEAMVGICIVYDINTEDQKMPYMLFKSEDWRYVPDFNEVGFGMKFIPWFANGKSVKEEIHE